MNLFFRELKASRKSLIIWCICFILMVASGMAKYGALSTDPSLNDMIAQMPRSLKTIMSLDSFDLTKAIGFYGILYLYLILMATIHAFMLGATIIAKEERDKTAEFLLVKPISRNKIITFKLLAAIVNIFIVNLVTLITSVKVVDYYNKEAGETHHILLLLSGMMILQLLFLFVGTAIAAVSKRPKSSVAFGTIILLAAFLLKVIIDLTDKIDYLKYITPFKYFEAKAILKNGELDPTFSILSIILIGIFISVTYIFYRKRDISV